MSLHHANQLFKDVNGQWIGPCFCGYLTKPQATEELALRYVSRHVEDKMAARR